LFDRFQLVRRQHFVFYPLMCIARMNLYVQSVLFVLKAPTPQVNKTAELLGLGEFLASRICCH
jgi:hypothetical protein